MADATESALDSDHRAGYLAFRQGIKMSADASPAFRSGWWSANDNGERFGPHETPNQAPEEPYHWEGADAPMNEHEEAVYRRGWNDALRWAYPGSNA